MSETTFFDENGMLGENDRILLRKIQQEEFPLFCNILGEGKKDRESYQTSEYMEFLEGELVREDALYCAIIRKADNVFCGYVGISELSEEPWEFAIELFKRYHRQGLGYQSLDLFLNSVKGRTGVNTFKSCVDGLNLASQKLMEKAKGTLVGVHMEDGAPVMVYQHVI